MFKLKGLRFENSAKLRELTSKKQILRISLAGYELCLMSGLLDNNEAVPGKIYLEKHGEQLKYSFLNVDYMKVEGILDFFIEGPLNMAFLHGDEAERISDMLFDRHPHLSDGLLQKQQKLKLELKLSGMTVDYTTEEAKATSELDIVTQKINTAIENDHQNAKEIFTLLRRSFANIASNNAATTKKLKIPPAIQAQTIFYLKKVKDELEKNILQNKHFIIDAVIETVQHICSPYYYVFTHAGKARFLPIIWLITALKAKFEECKPDFFNYFRTSEAPLPNICPIYLRACILDICKFDRRYMLSADGFLQSKEELESALFFYNEASSILGDSTAVYEQILGSYLRNEDMPVIKRLILKLNAIEKSISLQNCHQGFMTFFCVPKSNMHQLEQRPYYLSTDLGNPINDLDLDCSILDSMQAGIEPDKELAGRVSLRIIPQFLDTDKGDLNFIVSHLNPIMVRDMQKTIESIADDIYSTSTTNVNSRLLKSSFGEQKSSFSWLFELEKQYAQKRKVEVDSFRPLFIQEPVAQKMITFNKKDT